MAKSLSLKEMLELANAKLAGTSVRKKRAPRRPLTARAGAKKPKKVKSEKPIKMGKFPKDLAGNPIIPFEKRPVIRNCQVCSKDCKQREPLDLLYCPYFDPIMVEGKKARWSSPRGTKKALRKAKVPKVDKKTPAKKTRKPRVKTVKRKKR